MPTLNLAYIAELVLKYLRKGAYILLLASFWFAIAGMWTSFFTAFLYFYDATNNLFIFISNGVPGSDITLIQKMFGLLNCIGFIDAYNNTKAVFVTSIVFLFSRILFNVTLSSYRYYIDSVKPLVN